MSLTTDFLRRISQMNNPVMGNDMPSQGGISGMVDQPDYGLPGQTPGDGVPSPPMQDPSILSRMPLQDDSGQDMSGMNPQGPPLGQPGGSVAGLYANYTPEHSASDAYNAFLAQYPQHEKAGIMRTITAMLAGAGGGPEAAQKVLDEPFNEKLADWKNQIIPMGNAANLERYTNANERQLASQESARVLQEQKQAETERKNKEDEKIKEFRAQAYDFKARHPNWEMVKQTDAQGKGTYWFVNPEDPTQKVDTRLQDGQVDGYDLQVLKGNQAQKRTETSVAGQKEVAAEKNWDIFTANGKTYRISKEPGAKAEQVMLPGDTPDAAPVPAPPLVKPGTPKATSTGTGGTPTQQKIASYNKAQDIYNAHPEWQDWIHLTSRGPNTYTVDPPPEDSILSKINPFGSSNTASKVAYAQMQAAFKKAGLGLTEEGAAPNTSATSQAVVNPPAVGNQPAPGANPNPTGVRPDMTVKDALDYKNKRNQAIKILQDNHKVVSEDTIAIVMKGLP